MLQRSKFGLLEFIWSMLQAFCLIFVTVGKKDEPLISAKQAIKKIKKCDAYLGHAAPLSIQPVS